MRIKYLLNKSGSEIHQVQPQREKHKVELFQAAKAEEIFQDVGLQDFIWESVASSRNISLFALEAFDTRRRGGMLGGKSKESPSLVRLAVESIFAFIYYD